MYTTKRSMYQNRGVSVRQRWIEKEYMDVAEGEKVTATSVCADAVDYLFEGTEATQDILDTAVSAKMRMCREVMKWFMDDFTGKNEESLPEQATEKED